MPFAYFSCGVFNTLTKKYPVKMIITSHETERVISGAVSIGAP